ncbi:MAG: right-handed parallel beta-helix repeat-containing protein [Chthoniobacterales bacterium]
MKTFFLLRRGIFLGIATVLMASTLHAAPDINTFWVATNGNDSNDGSKAHPFLTLERARDTVRTVSVGQTTDITVNLRGGIYRLTQTFALTSVDSGQNGHNIVYQSAPGETAVICGSIPASNWTIFDVAHGIYRSQVGLGLQSRQLYVKGVRAVRARTSELPIGFKPLYPGGIEFIPTLLNPAAWRDPSAWLQPDKVEAVNYTQWKMTRIGVASVTPYPTYIDPNSVATGLLVMKENGWKNANIFLKVDPPNPPKPGDISFWQVSWFENSLSFLDEPREWYLDEAGGYLYYIPLWTENLRTAPVELPTLDILISGFGDWANPVTNISFKGLTFSYATWNDPSTGDGYVTDQSGFHVIGPNHDPNIIDHDPQDTRTPGNLSFAYAHNITFDGNIFEHLGAVALDFDTGSQYNTISNNLFEDISSAAIQIGGVDIALDAHPTHPEDITTNNTIYNNLIHQTGREFYDSAGIMVAFASNTTLQNNTINDCPWSAVALGWGWGLLDPGGFPGLPNATIAMWGVYPDPSTNHGGRVLNNRMYNFLNKLWDGGAVYTTGAQGSSPADALLISGNVATNKRPKGGGNIFYTDGGSRYINLVGNVSVKNAQGVADYGPPPSPYDPLPYNASYSALTGFPYGTDIGGCRTYGDINYTGNYWASKAIGVVCPYNQGGVDYPTDVTYTNEHIISPNGGVPPAILKAAGVRKCPPTIPAARWKAADAPQ